MKTIEIAVRGDMSNTWTTVMVPVKKTFTALGYTFCVHRPFRRSGLQCSGWVCSEASSGCSVSSRWAKTIAEAMEIALLNVQSAGPARLKHCIDSALKFQGRKPCPN
jgi:hypothetical protein